MDHENTELSRVMFNATGRNVDDFEPGFLQRTLQERQIKTGQSEIEKYLTYLEQHNQECLLLEQELSNTTSQFFREELSLTLLEHLILPLLLHNQSTNHELRIWSAGCATGQEPYTLAILLQELEMKLGKKIPHRIFATDVSDIALDLARVGVYEYASVQNMKLRTLNQFFTKAESQYKLNDNLKNDVSFSRYDLLDTTSLNPSDSIYGGFDLIFCCNLLIYYKPSIQQQILNKLIQSLSTHGFIIVGQVEKHLLEHHPKLKHFGLNSAIYQNKRRNCE